MVEIHSTAVIEGGAKIGESVFIGPYCCVGSNDTYFICCCRMNYFGRFVAMLGVYNLRYG